MLNPAFIASVKIALVCENDNVSKRPPLLRSSLHLFVVDRYPR